MSKSSSDAGLPVPLSIGQQRYWYLEQLRLAGVCHHVRWDTELSGELHREILVECLGVILRRHSCLRSAFRLGEDDQPHLVPSDADQLPLPVTDLSEYAADAQATELRRQIVEHTRQPFDWSKPLLPRARLFRLGHQRHLLSLVAHQVTADGWSADVFRSELVAIYEALSSGAPPALPELDCKYADFARWQHNQLQGAELERLRKYWFQALSGALPTLALPEDTPRPATFSFRGGSVQRKVAKELVDRVAELGRNSNATDYMVLLTVYFILLHRHTRQNDLIVGTPFANRSQPEFQRVVGFFANTLLIRARLSPEWSFKTLLDHVRGLGLQALIHQNMPIEHLVQDLVKHRDMSRPSLFQTLFMYLTRPSKAVGGGVTFRPVRHGSVDAKTDLLLSIVNTGQGLDVHWDYYADAFSASYVEALADQYVRLLANVCHRFDEPIGSLQLLERHELVELEHYNRPATELPPVDGFHQLFEKQAERSPDAPAVSCDGRVVTYRELDESSNRLANHLLEAGMGVGDRIGVCLLRSLDLVDTLLGVLKSGCAYVPLDPDYPRQRLAAMAKKAAVKLVVCESVMADNFETMNIPALELGNPHLERSLASRPASGVGRRDEAYVIFTSGSTGRPKGVRVTHEGVINLLTSLSKMPGLDADSVMLAITTLSFDIAVVELFLPLVVGARVVIAKKDTARDGGELARAIDSLGINVMQATPATWRLLVAVQWRGAPNFKALCGGETLPEDLARQLLARTASVWNLYGPTETTVWSTCFQITSVDGSVPIGRPIDNTQVYLLGDSMQPVPRGVVGELYIGGSGVSLGYLDEPERTTQRFVANPFADGRDDRLVRTGDAVRWRLDGQLELLHRIDRQVKLRGHRIEPGDVEAAISAHPAIDQSAVTLRGQGPDQQLVAYFVIASDAHISLVELRNYLRRKLPGYLIPTQFLKLDALPHSSSGKIDFGALPDPNGSPAGRDYVAPRNEVENVLASIWQEVLNIERVSVHDNFFDLGGHSLVSLRVASEFRRQTGLSVSVRQLYLETLEDIATQLAR